MYSVLFGCPWEGRQVGRAQAPPETPQMILGNRLQVIQLQCDMEVMMSQHVLSARQVKRYRDKFLAARKRLRAAVKQDRACVRQSRVRKGQDQDDMAALAGAGSAGQAEPAPVFKSGGATSAPGVYREFRERLRSGWYRHRTLHFISCDRYRDVCLVTSLRACGINLAYSSHGKMWAQKDGNEMLAPLGLRLSPSLRPLYGVKGRYIFLCGDHFRALRIHEDGLDVRDFCDRGRINVHYDDAIEFEADIGALPCSFWRIQTVELSLALEHYEAFHGMERGSASRKMVAGSSAGIAGWAAAVVEDDREDIRSFDRMGGASGSAHMGDLDAESTGLERAATLSQRSRSSQEGNASRRSRSVAPTLRTHLRRPAANVRPGHYRCAGCAEVPLCLQEAQSGPDADGNRYCHGCFKKKHGCTLAASRAGRGKKETKDCNGRDAAGNPCLRPAIYRNATTGKWFCWRCWKGVAARRYSFGRLRGKQASLYSRVPLSAQCCGILPDGAKCREEAKKRHTDGRRYCRRCLRTLVDPGAVVRRPRSTFLRIPIRRRLLSKQARPSTWQSRAFCTQNCGRRGEHVVNGNLLCKPHVLCLVASAFNAPCLTLVFDVDVVRVRLDVLDVN